VVISDRVRAVDAAIHVGVHLASGPGNAEAHRGNRLFWKPLRAKPFGVWVPGRKTDVSDAQWLCQLMKAGLLRGSFVPPKPQRELRTLTRYRKTQIAERQREANRLHKALEDIGIKLDCVASDILGKSVRAMLDALVAGTTDPEILAELAKSTARRWRRRQPSRR
jgi:transposase